MPYESPNIVIVPAETKKNSPPLQKKPELIATMLTNSDQSAKTALLSTPDHGAKMPRTSATHVFTPTNMTSKTPELPKTYKIPQKVKCSDKQCASESDKYADQTVSTSSIDVNKGKATLDEKLKAGVNSWASNYLQSISQFTTPIKLNLSSARKKVDEKKEHTFNGDKTNSTLISKQTMENTVNNNKTDLPSSSKQPNVKLPTSTQNTVFKPRMDTKTWLLQTSKTSTKPTSIATNTNIYESNKDVTKIPSPLRIQREPIIKDTFSNISINRDISFEPLIDVGTGLTQAPQSNVNFTNETLNNHNFHRNVQNPSYLPEFNHNMLLQNTPCTLCVPAPDHFQVTSHPNSYASIGLFTGNIITLQDQPQLTNSGYLPLDNFEPSPYNIHPSCATCVNSSSFSSTFPSHSKQEPYYNNNLQNYYHTDIAGFRKRVDTVTWLSELMSGRETGSCPTSNNDLEQPSNKSQIENETSQTKLSRQIPHMAYTDEKKQRSNGPVKKKSEISTSCHSDKEKCNKNSLSPDSNPANKSNKLSLKKGNIEAIKQTRINKSVTANKITNKDQLDKETTRLKEQLKAIKLQIKKLLCDKNDTGTSKQLTSCKLPKSGKQHKGETTKEKGKSIMKQIDTLEKNLVEKSTHDDNNNKSAKRAIKRKCDCPDPVKIQQKRSKNNIKNKSVIRNSSPESLQRKSSHDSSEKRLKSRSKSNKRQDSSENERDEFLQTQKRLRHDLRPTSETATKKQYHDSKKDSNKKSSESCVKSVVKLPHRLQVKHPRVKAPESESSDNDTSDFDLRSRLSKKHPIKRQEVHLKSGFKDKTEKPRENLLVTINRDNDAVNLPSQQPDLEPKQKLKKYKKIQLVINVMCQNQDDSSDDSEDKNSADTVNDNGCEMRNLDLSFLDDFNIEEIVSSLKNSPKLDNTDIKKTIIANHNQNKKQPHKSTSNKFVQPIIIKSEIKTEPMEVDMGTEPEVSNILEVLQEKVKENVSIDETNLRPSSPDELDDEILKKLKIIFSTNADEVNSRKDITQERGEINKVYSDSEKTEIIGDSVLNNYEYLGTNKSVEVAREITNIVETSAATASFVKCEFANNVDLSLACEEPYIKKSIQENESPESEIVKILHIDRNTEHLEFNLKVVTVKDIIDDIEEINDQNETSIGEKADKDDTQPPEDTHDISLRIKDEIIIKTESSKTEDVNIDEDDSKRKVNLVGDHIQEEVIDEVEKTSNEKYEDSPKCDEAHTTKKVENKLCENTKEKISQNDNLVKNTAKKDAVTKDNSESRTFHKVNLTTEYKLLASQIEVKLLEYINKDCSVISIINNGKYSKLFKFIHENGQYYAVKASTKYNLNISIEKAKMIAALQTDMPRVNLNTAYYYCGFKLDGQWCSVMEYYATDLRKVLSGKLFHIDEIQALGMQLVSAVMMLKRNNIVHSNINPSHILVDLFHQRLKLCALDTAYYVDTVDALPNIGSVAYRAPEIIVGYSAGFSIDVWSTACVLYAMTTGDSPFQGLYNGVVLEQQMRCFGKFPADMLRAPFSKKYFKLNFFMRRSGERGQHIEYINSVNFKKTDIIKRSLQSTYYNMWSPRRTELQKNHDLAKVSFLSNLLNKMFLLDPRRRLPIEYAASDFFMRVNSA